MSFVLLTALEAPSLRVSLRLEAPSLRVSLAPEMKSPAASVMLEEFSLRVSLRLDAPSVKASLRLDAPSHRVSLRLDAPSLRVSLSLAPPSVRVSFKPSTKSSEALTALSAICLPASAKFCPISWPLSAAFCPISCWSLLLPSSELLSSHPTAFPSPAQNSSTVTPAEQARHSAVAALQQGVGGPPSVPLAMAPWMVSLASETKSPIFSAPAWMVSLSFDTACWVLFAIAMAVSFSLPPKSAANSSVPFKISLPLWLKLSEISWAVCWAWSARLPSCSSSCADAGLGWAIRANATTAKRANLAFAPTILPLFLSPSSALAQEERELRIARARRRVEGLPDRPIDCVSFRSTLPRQGRRGESNCGLPRSHPDLLPQTRFYVHPTQHPISTPLAALRSRSSRL